MLPPDNLFFRNVATWIFSITHLAEGDLKAGVQALEDAVRMGRRAGNIMSTVMAKCIIGEVQVMQGNLADAEATYREALAWGSNSRGRPLPIAGMAMVGLGDIARERNELQTATQLLTEGIALCRLWGEVGAMDGLIGLARVKHAQGEAAEAFTLLAQAQQLAQKFDATDMDDNLVNVHHARLALICGDVETAVRWAAARELNIDRVMAQLSAGNDPTMYGGKRFRTMEMMTLARLLIQQKKCDQAVTLLAQLQVWVSQIVRNGVLLEILNLQALAFQAQQNSTEAVAVLSRALTLAQPKGYKRIFLDEGPVMWQLLKQVAARGIAPDYVAELLEGSGGETAVSSHSQPLLDPLSDREIDVLRLLAAGLSAPEIAEHLVIARSTVRSHVKSIYSKLDVHRKWDAVQRATELELL